jgi:hypothetical protein
MKKKSQIPNETIPQPDESQPSTEQPLSVMAVQEILGLFDAPKVNPEEDQDHHDYLKNKPLGLI